MLRELPAIDAGASNRPIRGKAPEQIGLVVPFRLALPITFIMNRHHQDSDLDQFVFPGEVVYAHDLRGNLTFLNHTGERLLGYSCEEVRRMNVADLISPEIAAQIQEQIAGIATENIGCVYEIDMTAKDGRRVPLELSMRVVFRCGRPVEIEGIALPSMSRLWMRAKTQRCLDDDFCNAM